MNIQFLNKKKSGGGENNITPNVFMQENEPNAKEGIWLKANKTVEKIVIDKNIVEGGNWDTINEYPDLPFNFSYYHKACIIENIIYLFDVDGKKAYTFDTSNLVCTQITDVTLTFLSLMQNCEFCAVDKCIYVLYKANNSYNTIYKFDTETRTCSTVYSASSGWGINFYITVIDTNIFIFDYYGNVYKFNTFTNNLTKLDITNPITKKSHVKCIAINNYIYIFGGYDGNSQIAAYRFDTDTNEFVQLTDMPYGGYQLGITNIGNDIYLFGLNSTLIYKYNVVDNVYTSVSEASNIINYSYATNINDSKIFVLGGTNTSRKIYVYVLNNKDYDNNSIIIWGGNNKYMTQLYTNPNIEGRALYGFYKAYYYTTENKLDSSIPLYYGNGEKWIKISGDEE